MKPDWWDLAALAGAASCVYGLGLIYQPLAWISGGLLLVWAGVKGPRLKNGDRS